MRNIDITKQDIRCIDDVEISNDLQSINFAYELWFDVDEYFGTKTKDLEDTWINFYTNYYKNGEINATVVISFPDKTQKLPWELTDIEKDFFRNKMEEYCNEKYNHSVAKLLEMWFEKN